MNKSAHDSFLGHEGAQLQVRAALLDAAAVARPGVEVEFGLEIFTAQNYRKAFALQTFGAMDEN